MHLHPVVWLIVIHPLLLRIVHVHVLLLLVAIVILLRWHVHHIIALHLVIRPAHHIVLHHHWMAIIVFSPVLIHHLLLALLLVVAPKEWLLRAIIQALGAWLAHGVPVLGHHVLSVEELLLVLLLSLRWPLGIHHSWMRPEVVVARHRPSTSVMHAASSSGALSH